jgi:Mor family transcriptional regulator
MNDLYDLVDFTKRSLGINDQVADQFAKDLSRNFGGEYLYVSKRHDQQQLKEEIRSQYDGTNLSKLARQYGLSRQHVFNLVNR